MKKLLCLLIALMMAVPALADAPIQETTSLYVCNPEPAQRLNLRAGPGQKYSSLGKYYTGVEVELLGESSGGYEKVRIGDTVGWMDTGYLTDIDPASQTIHCNVGNGGGQGANLRKDASMGAEIIRLCPNGTPVEILGAVRNDWCHVRTGGDIGYMKADLLDIQVSFDSTDIQPMEPGSMYIDTGHPQTNAPVYQEPHADAPLVAELLSGDMVIAEQFTADGWVRVWDGIEGWTHSIYLKPLTATPANGLRHILGVSEAGSGTFTIYADPESGDVRSREKAGTIFHAEAVLPRGWVMGWTENTSFGFVRAESLAEPLFTTSQGDRMYVVSPVKGNRLNLRTAPTKDAKSIAKFEEGVQVNVIGYEPGRDWAKVVVGDLQGYMDMSYLSYSEAAAGFAKAVVTAAQCEAKAGLEANSWTPGTVRKGDAVDVLGLSPDGMIYVRFESNGLLCQGWVPEESLAEAPAW